MASLKNLTAWKSLEDHHRATSNLHMRDLFAEDSGRFDRFSLSLEDLLVDFSKNRITSETLKLLCRLAHQAEVETWRDRMFSGDRINTTENRPVLHTALRNRSNNPVMVDGVDVMPRVNAVLDQMRRFSDKVRAGDWLGADGRSMTDVVNIGIGGSDLGPAMVTEALTPFHHPNLKLHFVSNMDGAHMAQTLAGLNPATSLFIVASKTFTTQETLTNAATARTWLTDALGEDAVARHFVAVSANADAATGFGIDGDNVFQIWDWVGGRYSLWSAIGLPIAIAVGMDNFEALLDGGHVMDRHFKTAPLEENMPVILALLGIWYADFFGAQSYAVLPYSQNLRRLPAYLQQAGMESNGKHITRDGMPVDYATGPVIFGEPGTNGQHTFFQLLHQGTPMVPADFIGFAEGHYPNHDTQAILLSNFFAQTEALMQGRTEAEARALLEQAGLSGKEIENRLPHVVFDGNRPTNSILCRRLNPESLGMLIALYEHKIFVQGVVWGINSFDQWGVELGKQLADVILPALRPGPNNEKEMAGHDTAHDSSHDSARDSSHDSSTEGLMAHYKRLMAGAS